MKKNSKNKDQFVLIYWKDAAMHGVDQYSRKEIKEQKNLVKGISGGILVYEDTEQITVALDYFYEHDQFRQICSYPKSGIQQIIRYYFKNEK